MPRVQQFVLNATWAKPSQRAARSRGFCAGALVARRAARICTVALRPELRLQRVYGATVARLTPDQKVGSSNLFGLAFLISSLSTSICLCATLNVAVAGALRVWATASRSLWNLGCLWHETLKGNNLGGFAWHFLPAWWEIFPMASFLEA